MFCCLYAPGNLPVLLDCARQFSPLIEEHPDMVVFDIHGLDALYGPPESLAGAIEKKVGLPANIVIAANPDAAVHAARGLNGVTTIATGEEAAVLAPLSLHLLGSSPDVALLLDLWGIRTFGQFAKLPPLGVAARLGPEGIALQELARGQGRRRLRLREETSVYAAEIDLDSPVELLDSLCFVLSRLLDELLAQIAPLATNEIRVALTLERAPEHVVTVRLPVPISDAKVLLKILHLELAGNPPSQAVVKVSLHAEPAKPRRTQRGLFAASSPEPERLETTLARIRHLVGAEHVGSPRLLNTHRPDRFVMHPFAPPVISSAVENPGGSELRLCLRRFRPPRYAQVQIENKRPVYLSAPSMQGNIATARGPWRVSGNWWSEDRWNRDRWDVALDSGLLLRLFEEIDSGRWFIEGSYD
jgi:protein ImuB